MANDAEVGRLHGALELDNEGFLHALAEGRRALVDFAHAVQGQLAKLNDEINRFSAGLTIGITVPVALASRAFINAASDVEEMRSAFGFTFGSMSKDVEKWAVSTGDSIGRATYELQQGALAFQQMFRVAAPTAQAAADMSKQFALLAQDLSSFYNTSPEVALQKLRSALQGESEPIRDFGVFLNETVVAQEALRMGLGKTAKALTEQDKILARASIILRDTATAQGDAERTAGSYANQLRALSAQWTELKVSFGEILLPIATKVVTAIAAVVKWFGELPRPVKVAMVAVAGFAAALGPLLFVVKGIGLFMLTGSLATSFGLLGKALAFIISPIQTLVQWIGSMLLSFGSIGGALSAAGGLILAIARPVAIAVAAFVVFRDYVLPVLQQLAAQIERTFGPRVTALIDQFQAIFAKLQNGPIGEAINKIVALMGVLLDIVGVLTAAIVKQFGQTIIVAIDIALTAFEAVVDMISGVVDLVTALLTGDWKGAWDAAGGIVKSFTDGIVATLAAAFPGVDGQLKAIYESAKKWLGVGFDQVSKWVNDAVAGMAKMFTSTFGGMAETVSTFYQQAKKYLVDYMAPILDWMSQFVDAIAKLWDSFKKGVVVKPHLDGGHHSKGGYGELTDAEKALLAKPGAAVAEPDKKKTPKAKTGKSAEEIEADYQEQLRQLRIEELRARLDLATNAEARAELEREILREEYAGRVADIKANKDFNAAQKAAQIAAIEKLYGGNQLVGEEQTLTGGGLYSQSISKELAEKRRRLEDDAIARQRAALEAEAGLEQSRQGRLVIERKILDLSEKSARSKLEEQIANGEIADAAQARADLERSLAAKRKGTEREYQGPLAGYLDSIPKDLAGINDQLETIAVKQLKRVEDGFANIATKVLGLHGALGEVIADLLRIVAQQAILAASKGGGGFSGFLSSVGQAFAGFTGGGSGGVTGAEASSWSTSSSLPGWASGGSGTIVGRRGVDANMLQINGVDAARVSHGERIRVEPAGGGGGRGGMTVHMPITLNAPGADAAALGRLQTEVRTLKAELPGRAIAAVLEAQARRIT